jgi:hypothetical protein
MLPGRVYPQKFIVKFLAGLMFERLKRGRPNAPVDSPFIGGMKVNETSLVPHLLFAFFKHLPHYNSIAEQASGMRPEAINQLNQILNTVFLAIREGKFDRQRYDWITNDLVEENFRNRDFNQYYPAIRNENVTFRATKSVKLRVTIGAIAAISQEVFLPRPIDQYPYIDDVYPYIDDVRSIMKLDRNEDLTHSEQARILKRIEETMLSIDNRPAWPISFDDEDRPVIKTSKAESFPSHGEVERDKSVVDGSFVLFRRVLQRNEGGKDYIREYLRIENKQFGLTFRWQSRGGDRNDVLVFVGVGFFTKGGLWLMGHTSKHLQRIRVLAADVVEWEAHKNKKQDFCTARLLTHRNEAKRASPATRPVLLKRDRPSFWKNEHFEDRCKFLTKSEIRKMLTKQEMQIVDGTE